MIIYSRMNLENFYDVFTNHLFTAVPPVPKPNIGISDPLFKANDTMILTDIYVSDRKELTCVSESLFIQPFFFFSDDA